MTPHTKHSPFNKSSPMSITDPDCNLDQSPKASSESTSADIQSPAPTRSLDCAYSVIDKEKLITAISGDTDRPRSQSATIAIRFYLRWTIIVLNVALELAQIVLTLEASGGRIKGPTYRALTAATSSICLLLSGIEAASHAARSKRGSVRRRKIGFAVWFGIVSSAVQFSVNVTAFSVRRPVVNFDYLGLMFAVCYFFAAINGDRSGHVAVVRCVSHGNCEAERRFVDGVWVFECSQCTDAEVKLA